MLAIIPLKCAKTERLKDWAILSLIFFLIIDKSGHVTYQISPTHDWLLGPRRGTSVILQVHAANSPQLPVLDMLVTSLLLLRTSIRLAMSLL